MPNKDELKLSSNNINDTNAHLSIVVIGASGDLAVKKTYPALYSLYVQSLLPQSLHIVGYARSKIQHEKFLDKISSKFDKSDQNKVQSFLNLCTYVTGQYNSNDDFAQLNDKLHQYESTANKSINNRVFYFAIPPNVFVDVARSVHASALTESGSNKIIVEKPFGRDLESSNQLGRDIGAVWSEEQIYRIDHYLGKEMVQNLMVLRFANKVFEPIWNRYHISSVLITFKENFGTQGRGGYFDSFGIIRDVMQNHLLQMLSLVAMEPPISLDSEDIRDEKVKLLRCISPVVMNDLVIGQYGAQDGPNGECKYIDDPTVPNDSITPTFACAALHINNTRWIGVPFILKCGKAIDSRKAEIRIQFRPPANTLFGDEISPNELVLRVQPDEAVYMKMTTKQPGLETGVRHTELDLSYKNRFKEAQTLPDAYERLIYDVLRGDHNLFVRADELTAAWKIFTPILHELESRHIKPPEYKYGGRGPPEADEMIHRLGYIRTTGYEWKADGPSATPRMHAQQLNNKTINVN